jgi:hypothetical protein
MKGIVRPLTYGRLGNYCFQIAAAMGYAWRHGLEFSVPDHTKSPVHNPIYFQHLANPRWDNSAPVVRIEEGTHAYQELPYKLEWEGKQIVLDGYWQTEKYFKEFRKEVIAAFGLEWKQLDGFVSVHLRRGDYLRLTHKHPPVPKEWIEEAMRQFPGYHFIFFSDDIAYCKETFGHRKDVSFSKRKDPLQDLTEMSWCEHQIGSASTFSLWGGYLNQNPKKRMIMPRLWFVPGHGGLDVSDIVPENWIRL